jgi:hypothetical protein
MRYLLPRIFLQENARHWLLGLVHFTFSTFEKNFDVNSSGWPARFVSLCDIYINRDKVPPPEPELAKHMYKFIGSSSFSDIDVRLDCVRKKQCTCFFVVDLFVGNNFQMPQVCIIKM